MNQTLERILPSGGTGAFSLNDLEQPVRRPVQTANPVRPVPSLMGIAFDPLTTREAVLRIDEMIASRKPHYVVTANVDFLVQARRDVELRRVLLDAHLVLCDGTPLLWLARALGCPLPERVAGSDLTPLLIERAADRGHRIFFLGGAPEVATKAVANLQSRHPKLIIAGHYSPPFRPLLEMDHETIARRIKEAKPDLLLVSFGCPKAEKWLNMNYRSLGVPVAIGIGATIDFLAGQMKRAPRWMQLSGTEWIFRLLQEPRRLLKRYLEDLWVFGWSVPMQLWQFRPRRFDRTTASRVFSMEEHASWNCITPPPHLEIEAVRRDALLWERAVGNKRDCFINLAAVRSLDSSGVGLLISLQKRLRAAGRELVLIAPSQVVTGALKKLRLQDFFMIAPNTVLANQRHSGKTKIDACGSLNLMTNTLEWSGEITAANAESIWLTTSAELGYQLGSAEPLVVDLTHLRFIDSAGIGVMVRVRKVAEHHGVKVIFRGANGNVRNVLRLAKLELHLLEPMP